jgi:hypothetical protein
MQTASIIRRALRWGVWSLLVASNLGGCVGAREAEGPAGFRTKADYQQPVRVAGGEVLGANQQDPDDTLRALPTNLHPAPGWEIEKGRLVRAKPGSSDAVHDRALPCARTLAAAGGERAALPGRAEETARSGGEKAFLASGSNCDPSTGPVAH